MLEIQNVSKTFNAGTVNQKTALNGLNLKLNEGDFVTVIGGNGAGKSTMLNAVAGVWPVDEGKILIDGVDVTRLSEHQRAAYIGRVFQDPMTSLNPVFRIGAQLDEVIALHDGEGKTPEDMMQLALAGFAPNVLDERTVQYQCDCSAERTKEMLLSLGRAELVRMRDEDPTCEVVCHFCHSKYQYDLNALLAEYDAQAAQAAEAEHTVQ